MLPVHPFVVVFIAIGVWWLSTGLVLAVVHRSETGGSKPAQLMALMTLLGGAGVSIMVFASGLETPLGSYAGFLGALLVWAWHEAAFLTGVLTGPRNQDCPPGLQGAARFRAAWQAVSDHEIAILVTAIALWLALGDGANLFGMATFGLLWLMRISAKLLIFFGAPHAVSELMPRRIAYLKTYFNTESTTPLFPLLLAGAAGLFAVLVFGAWRATEDHSVVGHTLLATFMALAIIEHLVLVLPVADTALWRWAMAKPAGAQAAARRHDDISRPGPLAKSRREPQQPETGSGRG